jgi:hypothetical protein
MQVFSFDLSQIRLKSIELAAMVEKNQHRALRQIADHVSGAAKDRAPFDEGTLTQDIKGEVQEAAIPAAVISVPLNAPSKDYAIQMHEGDYNLGPGSVAKQSRVGVAVGSKFIIRAIDDNHSNIMEIIKDNLSRGM